MNDVGILWANAIGTAVGAAVVMVAAMRPPSAPAR